MSRVRYLGGVQMLEILETHLQEKLAVLRNSIILRKKIIILALNNY